MGKTGSKSLRKLGGTLLCTATLLSFAAGSALATEAAGDAQPNDANAASADGQIHPIHLNGDVWLLAGEPGESNVIAQVGDQGVLVVDTGVTASADKLLAQIKRLAAEHSKARRDLSIIIDTDGRMDHIGGNKILRLGGSTIIAGNVGQDLPLASGATVYSDLNTLTDMVAQSTNPSKGGEAVAADFWPTDTHSLDQYNLRFNGSAVELIHPHNASTNGDYMVLFRTDDVVAAGDIVDMRGYPLIDTAHGGTIDGELVALNKLIQMAVPDHQEEGGTIVVPGHGHLLDQSDLDDYRNTLTVIRDRVQYYKNAGKTLAQVQALKPSWDYDGRWGRTTADWGAQQFVEAVYNTLPAKGPSFSMQIETVVPAGAAQGRRY